jgi:hypothetical protein
MRGAIPPLPQYAFMALCSVKAQGQLYLLPLPLAAKKSIALWVSQCTLLIYVGALRKTTSHQEDSFLRKSVRRFELDVEQPLYWADRNEHKIYTGGGRRGKTCMSNTKFCQNPFSSFGDETRAQIDGRARLYQHAIVLCTSCKEHV